MAPWLGLAGAARAQTDANVTGNVNVDGGAAYSYSQLPNPAGNINLKGDLLFTGSNAWIWHTPNDGRTSLYLAPGYPPTWASQTRFDSNGDVTFSRNSTIGQRLLVGMCPALARWESTT